MAMINEGHSSYRLRKKTMGTAFAWHIYLLYILNSCPVSLHFTSDQGAKVRLGADPLLYTRGQPVCFQSSQSGNCNDGCSLLKLIWHSGEINQFNTSWTKLCSFFHLYPAMFTSKKSMNWEPEASGGGSIEIQRCPTIGVRPYKGSQDKWGGYVIIIDGKKKKSGFSTKTCYWCFF